MVKLDNISQFWDTESIATWYFRNPENDYYHLYNSDFLLKYLALTEKYELATSPVIHYLKLDRIVDQILSQRDTRLKVCPLLFFYNHPLLNEQFGNNALVCPSWMYVELENEVKKVLITDLNDLKNENGLVNGDVPLKVNAFANSITLQLNTDGFFPIIPFSDKAYRKLGIEYARDLNNTKLAQLNGPRFNGFLHDFRSLMSEYDFSSVFEPTIDNAENLINESGIVM